MQGEPPRSFANRAWVKAGGFQKNLLRPDPNGAVLAPTTPAKAMGPFIRNDQILDRQLMGAAVQSGNFSPALARRI